MGMSLAFHIIFAAIGVFVALDDDNLRMAVEVDRRSGLPLTGKAQGEGDNHPLRRRRYLRHPPVL
jgi:hypothetical protein